MVVTLMPWRSRIFSEYRTVLKAPGRAPTAPRRTPCTPLTTRQTPRNFCKSAVKPGEDGSDTCLLVSENLMPDCTRLLHTEIFPQNASRRRAGERCFKSSG